MKKEFSKRLLQLDYARATFIILLLILGNIANAIYIFNIQEEIIKLGSCATITNIIDTNCIATVLSVWIAQLGISSTAYYKINVI